jgi:hypothetical protein
VTAGRTEGATLSILVLAVGALVGLLLVEMLVRRTDVGAASVLGLLLLLETGLADLSFDAGGVRVTANDLLFVALSSAAAARLIRLERLTTSQRLLVAFGVLVAWALVRGASSFGIPPAVNEGRKFLVFVGAAVYFSTVEPHRDLLDRIGRIWLVVAAGLCVLTLLRWTGSFVGITAGSYEGGGSLRVIPAAGALVVAQGALIAFPLVADRSRRLLRYLAPTLLVFVVLLQHRTIWVIAAAGGLYLLFRERAFAGRILAALGVALVLFTVLLFTVFDGSDDLLADQLSRSAQSTATFEWRMEGWRALVVQRGPDGPAEFVAGQPFGGGWERVMANGNSVEVSPHSFYVEPYLRVGMVGLALLLALYAIALRGSAAVGRQEVTRTTAAAPTLLTPNVLHTVIAVQLLYYVTYTPDAAQALLLGLGLAVATQLAGRRTPSRQALEVSP